MLDMEVVVVGGGLEKEGRMLGMDVVRGEEVCRMLTMEVVGGGGEEES